MQYPFTFVFKRNGEVLGEANAADANEAAREIFDALGFGTMKAAAEAENVPFEEYRESIEVEMTEAQENPNG